MTLQQAMELAAQHHQAGRVAQAEQIYRQVLGIDPNQPDALHLLGVIAMHAGHPDAAIELISRALAQNPRIADLHYNIGLAQMIAGRPAQALEPFRRTIALNPTMAEARSNLAAALLFLRQLDEAIEVCRQSLAAGLESPDLLNAFGVALKEKGKTDEAIAALERAVALRPDYCEAMSNLGNALKIKGRLAEAIAVHRRAVTLRPDVPELHNNLGRALDDDYQYAPAVAEFRRALELRPVYPEAQCSLASALHRIGQFEEAIAASHKAIQQWPGSALPRFNLSLMLLLQGRFDEGWPLHESRWEVPDLRTALPEFGRPKWEGQDLNGRTILLYAEQGYGDAIQFARYAPLVAGRGAKVILQCQPELVRLMRTLKGLDQIAAWGNPRDEFDFHCPLLSLPAVFKTNLSDIPAMVPYLSADAGLASSWKERIRANGDQIKIGLAWAGRPTHTNDRNRSIPLSMLASLGQVAGTRFYSLQKGDAAAQTKTLPPGFEVADFKDELNDFADTAAMIENLDLVISADTAVAHLAAAMGKPVWLLLPFVPDWRWMLGRNDSPWYPTMRLFRQPVARDWKTVLDDVQLALGRFRK